MKNHGNTISKKENDTSLETTCKVTEDWSDREFEIAYVEKLKELQENSGSQFSELRNKINDRGILSMRLELWKGAKQILKWGEEHIWKALDRTPLFADVVILYIENPEVSTKKKKNY